MKKIGIVLVLCFTLLFTASGCGGKQSYDSISTHSYDWKDNLQVPYRIKKAVSSPHMTIFTKGNLQIHQELFLSLKIPDLEIKTQIIDSKYLLIEKIGKETHYYYMIIDMKDDENADEDSRFVFLGMDARIKDCAYSLLLPYHFFTEFGYKQIVGSYDLEPNIPYKIIGGIQDFIKFYAPQTGYVTDTGEDYLKTKDGITLKFEQEGCVTFTV